MKLRRYAVTVMDNWTPMRFFFTLRGALRFLHKHPRAGRLYQWRDDTNMWGPRPQERQYPKIDAMTD